MLKKKIESSKIAKKKNQGKLQKAEGQTIQKAVKLP